MKFTEEQLAKMKAAKTAEELIALAKAEGIEATEEEIRARFDAMHTEGEIADDELDNVAGGCGEHSYITLTLCSNPRCSRDGCSIEGDHRENTRCPECGREMMMSVYDATDKVTVWKNY